MGDSTLRKFNACRWNVESGKELTKYAGHVEGVNCLQVFQPASWVITADAECVRVFVRDSGCKLYTLWTHRPRPVTAISIEGWRLFSTSSKVSVTELRWLWHARINFSYDLTGHLSGIDRIAQRFEARGDFALRGSTLCLVFLQLVTFAARPEVDLGNKASLALAVCPRELSPPASLPIVAF